VYDWAVKKYVDFPIDDDDYSSRFEFCATVHDKPMLADVELLKPGYAKCVMFYNE
jgi:hypothetical protein